MRLRAPRVCSQRSGGPLTFHDRVVILFRSENVRAPWMYSAEENEKIA
jgi:hypothetical protein